MNRFSDYTENGWKFGLDPHPLFDVDYYTYNDDVRIASYASPSVNSNQYFREFSLLEGRITHSMFASENQVTFSTVIDAESKSFEFVQNDLNRYSVRAFPHLKNLVFQDKLKLYQL